jgi:phage shock protein PspC (stress-responsive transcriptional regulator)
VPPLTAFAWRHRLVRPAKGQGRVLTGVCGALARATNTDPVLWRVILVVLSLFGGIGIFTYIAAWLLLPADGDTATPVEAVLGRGRSSTSAAITAVAAVVVLVSLGVSVSEPFRPGPWAVVLVVVAAVVLLTERRGTSDQAWSPAAPPPTVPVDTPSGGTTMSTPTAFAPYGPYSAPPTAPLPPTPTVPRPPRPRSRLGRLIFSIALIVLGLIGLADLAGVSVPFGTYLAAALAVLGIGMIVGAWYGRARLLIAPGIILAIVVGSVGAFPFSGFHGGEITWRPATLSQVESSYDNSLGDATLDLSGVDFSQATGPVTIRVSVRLGNLTVIVPSNVDTTTTATVHLGNANVFNQSFSGANSDPHTFVDNGADGPGGGQLTLDARVDLGNLEVHR